VLDFRRGPRPTNYLTRRSEWRLLLLVLLLGLTMLFALEARDPRNFEWLWEAGHGRGAEHSGPSSNLALKIGPEKSSPTPAVPLAKEGRIGVPPVNPLLLQKIQDDAPFRNAERDAWFEMLKILEGTSEQVLEDSSIGRVAFIQLYQQPDQYRGELVTIRGTIRRTEYLPAAPNDDGFERYHRVVIQPQDHPRNPVIGYVLQLPEAMPTGMEIEEEAKVTGFFFKRWEYLAQSDLETAPVILAKTVRWMPAPAMPADGSAEVPLGMMIALAAGFAVLASYVVYRRTRLGSAHGAERFAASRVLGNSQSPMDVAAELEAVAEREDLP
jgi:hypothetical protein